MSVLIETLMMILVINEAVVIIGKVEGGVGDGGASREGDDFSGDSEVLVLR